MLNKSNRSKHLVDGRQAEIRALHFLQQQGLCWQASNYRCQYGELDLVFLEADTLVVIEVRYRKNDDYGGAAASITPQKQARIIKATQHYVIMKQLSHLAVRFDVVAVAADKPLEWIKNAFQT